MILKFQYENKIIDFELILSKKKNYEHRDFR